MPATVPLICAESTASCSSLNVYDVTGTYSATNLTGWGLPMVDISTITTAVLNIYAYNPTTGAFDPSAISINVFSLLPNINDIPFVLTAAMLGAGTIEDNWYWIKVTYSDGTTDYVAEKYFLQSCAAKCCFQKLVADGCSCSGANDKARELRDLLELLDDAACCGNLAAGANILKKIKKICSPCGCH